MTKISHNVFRLLYLLIYEKKKKSATVAINVTVLADPIQYDFKLEPYLVDLI